MNTLLEITGFRRAMALTGAAGIAAALIAFVPSPLRVLDLFASRPALEVTAPPPLKMKPMPAIATFEAIAERPLFNADRKPDPSPPPPEPPKPAIVLGDLAQYRLLGVTGDRRTQRALVQKAGGAPLTLKPGDTFEGWTVDKIDAAGVAISGGDRKETLAIPKAQNRVQSP